MDAKRVRNWFGREIEAARDPPPTWPGAVILGGFGMLAAGAIGGFISRDTILGSWAMAAVKTSILGGGALALGGLGRLAWDAVYARWLNVQHDRLELEAERVDVDAHRMRNKITVLRPDPEGRKGVVYDGRTYHDLDTHAVYRQELTLALHPVLEQGRLQLEAIRALAKAIPPNTVHTENIRGDQLLAEGETLEAGQAEAGRDSWRRVTLGDLRAAYGVGNYHKLLLGETIGDDGKRGPVWADLADAVHLLVSGATKWGKSTFVEALAKQLVLSDDCDLAFVDLGVNTFGMLEPWARWPIASTPGLVVELFRQLCQEMTRRQGLMAHYPQVKTLEQYNQLAGDDLRPILVLVDEASVLFDRDSGAQEYATDLARMGRKVRLGCGFAGTDFLSETLPTSARGCCGARFAFHLDEPGLSRSIIRSTAAVNLRDRGRMLALLPGVPGRVEIQAPIVTTWADLPKARGHVLELARDPQPGEGLEVEPEPELTLDDVDGDPDLPDGERVRAIVGAGFSKRKAEIRVFGYPGGAASTKVDQALAEPQEAEPSDGARAVTWCEFCDSETGPFAECAACGVAVCADCARGGLCPDCQGQA